MVAVADARLIVRRTHHRGGLPVAQAQTLKAKFPPVELPGEPGVPFACQILRETTGNSEDRPWTMTQPEHRSAGGRTTTAAKEPKLSKLMSGDELGIAAAALPGRPWAVRGRPTTTSNDQGQTQPCSVPVG